MRRNLGLSVCLAALGAASVSFSAAAASFHDHSSLEFSIRQHSEPETCADLEIDAGGRSVERAEQHFTVVRGPAALSIVAPDHGGIVISGWGGAGYDVLACKAGVGASAAQARERLGGIDVAARGSAIETRGPRGDDWMVYLIVRAPDDAVMELETENGPLSLHDASGRFTVRGSNGPVSLDNVTGEVSVEVENGPVSVVDGGGHVKVRTENGPIAVSLRGETWEGEGLEARAVNGPLALDLAEGYRGGVLVESSGNAPWSCGGFCGRGERTWDDGGRQIEIGPRPARVRLSTVNGPVAIDEQ
jgi:hypothetical protein